MQNGQKTITGVRANPDRQHHLLPARSGGHRVPPAPSRRALKTRKETMSGISRSPVLKPKPATRSGQRTTTSTPNIISDRCPRTQKRHRPPAAPPRVRETRIDAQAGARAEFGSVPSGGLVGAVGQRL